MTDIKNITEEGTKPTLTLNTAPKADNEKPLEKGNTTQSC